MRLGFQRRSRRTRNAGFSLLEVMYGTVVLMVCLLAAFTSQLLSLNLMRQARDVNTAASELTAAIEEVTAPSVDEIPVTYAAGAAIARYEGRALRDERVVVTYPNFGGGSVPTPLEIRVTINWTGWNGRPGSLTYSTMKTR
ncbi:MAG: hypothetical protein JNN27_04950 [Planctomycetes bacterium]|nr:hypothetical protein [Planctomycetota bacterium]